MTPKPLTAEQLIKVGKCCGCGCTNCPYDPKHTKGTTKLNRNYIYK
jgi:hypothetical protein